MLFVFLVLLPDGGVGGDDLAVSVVFEVAEQRFYDVVFRASVERAAICGDVEQRWVLIFLLVLAQYPEG